ncbi:MAG TPA: hypothetical protein VGQ62_22445 [Chloroflexota bacterium]|jgi:hypothetical protein|nr:hypothetical protein [Chloroflexota bacterium]
MTTYLLQRIGARALAGLWRQKQTLAVGMAMLVGVVGYLVLSPTLLATPAAAAGVTPSGGTTCADTTMTAIAQKTPAALQQAYQCMDVTFQQRTTEQQFAAQVQASGLVVTHIARVGVYHDPSGSTLVYYALNSTTQSIGYVVYVDANGLVAHVQ